MKWLLLTTENQLEEITKASFSPALKGVVLFKHSTRCSISAMALNRLERDWNIQNETMPAYYLDLLKYRSISDRIASLFGVEHQSPQVLLIKDGKCIYTASHSAINVADLKALSNQ